MVDATVPWIIGCGDVGRRILRRYREDGVRPVAVVRGGQSAAACRALGGEVLQRDLDGDDALPAMENARVIYLAPPPGEGVTDPRLRRLLAERAKDISRLVLVSTTGVYGDCEGEWVDEDTPAAPQTDRGRRRLDAERAVIDWARARRGSYVILRVPGIYAEDRLPVSRLESRLPVVREAESGYTNRIHAEDLARICMAALASDASGLVLNATDGHPTTMTAYFNRVADALGMARPPEVSLEEARTAFSPGMLSYALESRKISNRRLLEVLGVTLEYPDLGTTLARLHVRER